MTQEERSILRYPGGKIMAEQDEPAVLYMMEVALLFDYSSSMAMHDAGEDGQQKRWDVAVNALGDLKAEMGDDLGVIAFNDVPTVVTGNVPGPSGMTGMGPVLKYIAPLSELLKCVVLISDGEPTASSAPGDRSSREDALYWAERIKCPLKCVYVGRTGGPGEEFLQRLSMAARYGGHYERLLLTAPLQLLEGLRQLLLLTGPTAFDRIVLLERFGDDKWHEEWRGPLADLIDMNPDIFGEDAEKGEENLLDLLDTLDYWTYDGGTSGVVRVSFLVDADG